MVRFISPPPPPKKKKKYALGGEGVWVGVGGGGVKMSHLQDNQF